MSLNSCTFQGRLTKDPEMRTTQSGKSVTNFSLAVDRDFEKGKCDFVNCVAWGKTAEFTNQYFVKGQEALIRGQLQMREWTDNSGNKRTSAEINVAEIHFCGPKKKDDKAVFVDADEVDDEEELPF